MQSLITSRAVIFIVTLAGAALTYAATAPRDPRQIPQPIYSMTQTLHEGQADCQAAAAAVVLEQQVDANLGHSDSPPIDPAGGDAELVSVALERQLFDASAIERPRSPFVLGTERSPLMQVELPQATPRRVVTPRSVRTSVASQTHRSARTSASPWAATARGAARTTKANADRQSMFRKFDGMNQFSSRGRHGAGARSLSKSGSAFNRNARSAYHRKWWE